VIGDAAIGDAVIGDAVTGVSGGRTNRDLLTQAGRAAQAAATRAGVQVRQLETLEQMTAACVVLDRVWGIGPGEVSEVQPALLRALGHGGNYLFGAYRADTGELVGASVAFFTEPLGAAMHSHITGVLGDASGFGVGSALKWHQRQWALERGLTRVTWTFDPLIARNAHFNLTRLGARAETYFVDFYGPMNDGPNRGQPTDRVQVGWDLAGPGVPPDGTERQIPSGTAVLLSVGPDGEPVAGRPLPGGAELALIGIPDDIESMRRSAPGTALAWRHALRGALALLMADRSWQITTFAHRRDARAGWYVAERRLPTVVVGDGS
jgi:predicted GNAT superfamily acetyltransferase